MVIESCGGVHTESAAIQRYSARRYYHQWWRHIQGYFGWLTLEERHSEDTSTKSEISIYPRYKPETSRSGMAAWETKVLSLN